MPYPTERVPCHGPGVFGLFVWSMPPGVCGLAARVTLAFLPNLGTHEPTRAHPQEETVQGFPTDVVAPALVNLLNYEHNPGLSV